MRSVRTHLSRVYDAFDDLNLWRGFVLFPRVDGGQVAGAAQGTSTHAEQLRTLACRMWLAIVEPQSQRTVACLSLVKNTKRLETGDQAA